jgi:hypothetical protein
VVLEHSSRAVRGDSAMPSHRRIRRSCCVRDSQLCELPRSLIHSTGRCCLQELSERSVQEC